MKSWKREILTTGIYLLAVLIITFLIIRFVGQRTKVKGPSMQPTLTEGDNLIVDKITYRFRNPKRFEIIVFRPVRAEDTETYYIKRVIGLPGETVHIDEDGVIYINGEALQESYGAEQISPSMIKLAAGEIVLGEDEYFVMGDNRNHSMDSRDAWVGNVSEKYIIGRAVFRIWPFRKFGTIH